MSSPLVSVLMTTYNRGSKIGPTIESILAQTYRNFELVIVNNGSTDDSRAILDAWASRDSRIKVFHQENLQMAGGRNATLRHARGEYFAIIDSDDFWSPEKIELQVESFSRSTTLGLVCTDFDCVTSGKIVQTRALKTTYLNWQNFPTHADLFKNIDRIRGIEFAWGPVFSEMLFGNLALPSSVMISRVAAQKAGFLLNRYASLGEDYEYTLRISKDWDIGFLDAPLVQYTVGSGDQLSGSVDQQVGIAQAYLDIFDEYVSMFRDRIRFSDLELKKHRAKTLSWVGASLAQVGRKAEARSLLIQSLKFDLSRKATYKELIKTLI